MNHFFREGGITFSTSSCQPTKMIEQTGAILGLRGPYMLIKSRTFFVIEMDR